MFGIVAVVVNSVLRNSKSLEANILCVACWRSWILEVDESARCTKVREVAGFILGIKKGSCEFFFKTLDQN